MHLFNIILALMATFSMVKAAPVEQDSAVQDYASPHDRGIVAPEVDIEEPETESFSTLGCPNGWKYCGKCNGTRCKVGGLHFGCKEGTSCTRQSGGGDGKLCGANGLFNGMVCPGKTRRS
ncbi:pyridoxamine-phosphate oxidase [Aspergillus melleus]|uniref:pyridoxamine-phosphate oxidase n=1 Tax=Aspergillus melleus TaxID=138277 RepID=UPI001E8D28BE|nr:pyridoxamine-phosphate oxidase [Aspergillus melleus]KAH8427302.1 pyridoxamine-phosphate oxidase [Aspergillus melleus]